MIESSSKSVEFPRLRPELVVELVAGPNSSLPIAIVTDPIRNRYFRLAWPESIIVLHWQSADTFEQLETTLAKHYGLVAPKADIETVIKFAATNQLTAMDTSGAWKRFAAIDAAGKRSVATRILHGYLFFRLPLVNPECVLRALEPRLSFFFRRGFWLALLAVALVAIYLAQHQWSAITSALGDALRLEGLHVYAAAVIVLKAIHELGHGLTTVRYGCRVPSMGVAVILGAPVLYTDTSDSWRLAKRSERMKIVFAGVAAELIVATIALLLWSFLPDGLTRQICFALATTSLVLSLSINLNPLMRFDGYFALSDYLGIPNLQARAFDLGLWRLREALFALGHPPPEQLAKRTERILIGYAICCAIYRFFLFLGIAAIVYALFGKAIGLVLAAIEIGIFIGLPIWAELKAWWQLRREIMSGRRAGRAIASVAIAAGVFFVPWISTVEIPAVLAAEKEESIYLPFPARLVSISVTDGQLVRKGEILFRADASDLSKQRRKAVLELKALEFQSSRLHASDKEREARLVVESRLVRAQELVASIERQISQLDIRAPFDGRIVDLDRTVSSGLWLNQKRSLARVVSVSSIRVKGLVSDEDIARVKIGASAQFIPDDAAAPQRKLSVTAIAPAGHGRIAEPILSERHGGRVSAGEERGRAAHHARAGPCHSAAS
jgi:putative peptide zinc metalloprotease protein